MSPIVRHVCRHCWVAGKSETFQFRANKTGRKQSQLSHLPFGFFACKRTTTGGTTQLCYTRVSVTKQTTQKTQCVKNHNRIECAKHVCVCMGECDYHGGKCRNCRLFQTEKSSQTNAYANGNKPGGGCATQHYTMVVDPNRLVCI